jgi:hypothetical protein
MAYSSSFMDSDWQPQSAATAPVGIRFWLLFCAFWSCAGWILSVVHLLNPMGYSMAVLVGAVLLAVFYKRVIQRGRTHPRVGNPVRRFRRIVPLTFLILGRCAILAARGLRYIWVGRQAFQMFSKQPLGKWLEQIHGEELLDMGLELRAGQGVSHWALVELLP